MHHQALYLNALASFCVAQRNRQHIDDWEVPPIAPEKQEELPKMDLNDARCVCS